MTGVKGVDRDFSVVLGARIRELRVERGWSPAEFAQRLGLEVRLVEAVERGRVSPQPWQLARMADGLGHGVGDLVAPIMAPAHLPQSPPREESTDDWRTFGDVLLEPPLQAALEVFAETGYHGTTVRHIADRWGLSVAGMYHHYPSKQAILAATLEALMAEIVRRCEAAVAEAASSIEEFTNLVECLSLVHTANPEWGAVGRSEIRHVVEPARGRIREHQRRVQALLSGRIEDGVAAGYFRVTSASRCALDIVMMCAGAAEWLRSGGPLTPETLAHQHVQHALRIVGSRLPE